MEQKLKIEKHSLFQTCLFNLKTSVFISARLVRNATNPLPKFNLSSQTSDDPIVAESKSDLWNPFDNSDNWILTAGKIENLRIAARKLNGLEVKQNQIFSFWAHVGKPSSFKGYVTGREIREGCLVPTTAGGLCQLSNALYDAALTANFEIIERHKHTKVIRNSLAEKDRDATVKWNYVDLQFKSQFNYRLEVELTATQLIVRFRGFKNDRINENQDVKHFTQQRVDDCFSCGNIKCFNHSDQSNKKSSHSKTTFILDERWPEFDKYISETCQQTDTYIIPLKLHKLFTTKRYEWSILKGKRIRSTNKYGLLRAIKLRMVSKQNNVFETFMKFDKLISNAAIRKIPVSSTHVVISQNFLPFLWESGALGGRTYDVLMTRLPLAELHSNLDRALQSNSQSKTLSDYRADKRIVESEKKALEGARLLISPHTEIHRLYPEKVVKLDWALPKIQEPKKAGKKILFPASLVGRKGAFEIRKLLKDEPIAISISGKFTEGKNFLKGLDYQEFNGDFNEIKLVIYPAHIENQPRQLLKAISMNIPVIASTACGIPPSELVRLFETGNYEEFRTAVIQFTSGTSN